MCVFKNGIYGLALMNVNGHIHMLLICCLVEVMLYLPTAFHVRLLNVNWRAVKCRGDAKYRQRKSEPQHEKNLMLDREIRNKLKREYTISSDWRPLNAECVNVGDCEYYEGSCLGSVSIRGEHAD